VAVNQTVAEKTVAQRTFGVACFGHQPTDPNHAVKSLVESIGHSLPMSTIQSFLFLVSFG
jgi:hypothetical protein